MFSLISFIRTLAMTLVVVVLLQIKIGEFTLEQRAVDWYRTSSLTQPVQDVANGGAKLVRDILNKVANGLKIDLFDKVADRPGRRDLGIRLERSQQYIQEKTRAAARKIQEELEEEKRRDRR